MPSKPTRQALAENAAWKPAKWELADASALQALSRGDASPDLQKRALDWIIRNACCTYEMSFRPGDSSRETDFAEGRRFVGIQIRKLLLINTAHPLLRREENV